MCFKKCEKTWQHIKGKTHKSTVVGTDLNTRLTNWKNHSSNHIEGLKDVKVWDVIHIDRAHLVMAESTFFSNKQKAFTQAEHVMAIKHSQPHKTQIQ